MPITGPIFEKQKNLQTLLNVPKGTELPCVKKQCSLKIMSLAHGHLMVYTPDILFLHIYLPLFGLSIPVIVLSFIFHSTF
jgi:hypothetical protein